MSKCQSDWGLDSDYIQVQDATNAEPRMIGAVLDEEQSLFLTGEQVTNFDDDVDDSPENDLALNWTNYGGEGGPWVEYAGLKDVEYEVDSKRNMTDFQAKYGTKATVQDGRVMVQDVRERYNANKQGRLFQRNNARGNVVARNVGGQNRCGNRERSPNFDDDVDDPPEKDLALQWDSYICCSPPHPRDAFDSDVDGSNITDLCSWIDELTRKECMRNEKPSVYSNKVKFAPPDYSKENYLAIFAPRRDLTPEQIFWAKDENDRKKVEASVLKPLSTPTVYPPNTPVKLVPRVLPTKS
ncbi:hypothetical protein Tco_0308264 [Tanacetum coccineum]